MIRLQAPSSFCTNLLGTDVRRREPPMQGATLAWHHTLRLLFAPRPTLASQPSALIIALFHCLQVLSFIYLAPRGLVANPHQVRGLIAAASARVRLRTPTPLDRNGPATSWLLRARAGG